MLRALELRTVLEEVRPYYEYGIMQNCGNMEIVPEHYDRPYARVGGLVFNTINNARCLDQPS